MAFLKPSLLFFGLLLNTFLSNPFFYVALLLIIGSLWTLREERYLSKHGKIATGTVTAVQRRQKWTRYGPTTLYDNTITFQMLEKGEPSTFVLNTGVYNIYDPEQQVRVIYLPKNPKIADIDGRNRWIWPYLILSFGLILLILILIFSTL